MDTTSDTVPDKIKDAEDLIQVLTDNAPDLMVKVLWTEFQSMRDLMRYWQGRADMYRSKNADESEKHQSEIASLKAELAAAQAEAKPAKITLMALDKAESGQRNSKIDAIKTFRDDTGLGLSESKQAVEWVWDHTKIRALTPKTLEYIVRFSESSSSAERALYNTLVADNFFGNTSDAELFCLEVWKLLG